MAAKLMTRNFPWAANRMRWKCQGRFTMTRNLTDWGRAGHGHALMMLRARGVEI
jgi:hypothetical protein